jgi:hypothetical protein
MPFMSGSGLAEIVARRRSDTRLAFHVGLPDYLVLNPPSAGYQAPTAEEAF